MIALLARRLARRDLAAALSIGLLACGCAGEAVEPPPPPTGEVVTTGEQLAWPDETAAEDAPADDVPLPDAYRPDEGAWRPRLPTPSERGAAATPLVQVGSRTLTTADLGDYLLRYLPDQAESSLSQLMEEALVEQEARAEGITADPAAVQRMAVDYVEGNRRAAQVEYGPDVSFEELLRERYGRDLVQYTADARRLARSAYLRDRLVRLDQLRRPGVLVRALLVRDETRAVDVARRVAAGADMTALASRAGLRPPLFPPPVDPAAGPLYERLSVAAPGEVVGPLAFDGVEDGAPRRFWQIVKILSVWEASEQPWGTLREQIEAPDGSLRLGPVRPSETKLWRARAVERHGVRRLTPEPPPTGVPASR